MVLRPTGQHLAPQEFDDNAEDDSSEKGYLYLNTLEPWLPENMLEKIPEEWLEERNGNMSVIASQRKNLPAPFKINGATSNGAQ